MTMDLKHLLDLTGQRLLRALQEDARLSLSELGRRVALSPPAVAERVRRLEETGIIQGYHAQVNPANVGRSVIAFIALKTPAERYPAVIALAEELPDVLECHHVSGENALLLQVATRSVAELEQLIRRFSPYGQTSTSIVFSTPVYKTVIEPIVE